MKKRLYGAALALVIFIGALMLGGCLTTTSPEEAEDNMHDLLDNYTDVNELRTVWKNRTAVRRVYEKRATPLVAAIILDPGRVPVLIDKGANPSGVQGQTISPLQCAINADRCRRTFLWIKILNVTIFL